jgi:hypothetical protein
MLAKDRSFMKKEGWEEYRQKSWLLLPKINGRVIDSLVFYATFAYFVYFTYYNGGVIKSIKDLGEYL